MAGQDGGRQIADEAGGACHGAAAPRRGIVLGVGPSIHLPAASVVRKTLQSILAEYGTIALVLYLSIFALVLGGFTTAMWLGWRPTGATGTVGTLTAAYIATKLTQPVRIGATLVLTPIVARLYERATGRQAGPKDVMAESGSE